MENKVAMPESLKIEVNFPVHLSLGTPYSDDHEFTVPIAFKRGHCIARAVKWFIYGPNIC